MAEIEDITLEEAGRQLEDARERGDRAAEAEVRSRKAFVHTARDEMDAAVDEMTTARDLYDQLGDRDALMRTEYGLGLLLARVPDRSDEALAAFDRAELLARELGDRAQQMKAQRRKVGIHEAAGRNLEAIAELHRMIAELEEWSDLRGLVDGYRHRATLHQAAGNAQRAREDHARAVEAAEQLGDANLLLQVRIEQRALLPALTGKEADESWDSWEALGQEAEASGQAQLVGSATLQQAAECMRTGRIDDGLELAAKARDAALASSSAMLYLLSCLLIAEGRDKNGDDLGVLAILLPCKADLEEQFGEPLGEAVVRILDSLPQRWGHERFEAALAEYRQRAREHAPGQ